ncbi:hypothetical protein KQ875_01045 [Mycoplasma zalophi]|uniref:Lipoprotein n=1 Tax=Mycoplasma zalophi TaxID=191287 RepID=A0ABS6DPC8_9MOLU|nr:hypothetical protein [Mycoplasma zalophi]MBU4692184.1 hypothetical protein [Mycoplasma zalophi]
MKKQKKNLLFVGSAAAITAVAATAAAISASCTTAENNNEVKLSVSQKTFMNLNSRVNVLRDTLEDKEMYKTTFDNLRRLIYDENKAYNKLDENQTDEINSLTGNYSLSYDKLVEAFAKTYEEVEVKEAEELVAQLSLLENQEVANDYKLKIQQAKEAIFTYKESTTTLDNKPARVSALVETEKALWNATVEIKKLLAPETVDAKTMYEFALATAEALMNYSEDKQGYESIFDDLFVRNFYAQKMAQPGQDSDYEAAYNYLWPETNNVHGPKFIQFYEEEVAFARELLIRMKTPEDLDGRKLRNGLEIAIRNSSDLLAGVNVTLLQKINGKIELDDMLKYAQAYQDAKEARIRAELLRKAKEAYDAKLAEVSQMETLLEDPKYATILKELQDSKTAETTPVSEKEANNTIEPTDYNNAVAKLEEALAKAKQDKEAQDALEAAKTAYETKLAEVKDYSTNTLTGTDYANVKTTLDNETTTVENRVDEQETKTVELYNKAATDLTTALEKAKAEKAKIDAKKAYETSKATADTSLAELKKEPKYSEISDALDAEIKKAVTEATKDTTDDYVNAKDILDKAITKATEDRDNYELNQAKKAYEEKVAEANAKELDDYPKTKANLTAKLAEIDNGLANPRTVESYNTAKDLVQTEIDNLDLAKAKEAYETKLAEVNEYKETIKDSEAATELETKVTEIDNQVKENPTVDKYDTGKTDLEAALVKAKAHHEYTTTLAAVIKDKDTFEDSPAKTKYENDINTHKIVDTNNATTDQFTDAVIKLKEAQLEAHKTRYEAAKEAYEDKYTEKDVENDSKYADAKTNKETKQDIIDRTEVAERTTELYDSGTTDFKNLLALLDAQLSFLDKLDDVKTKADGIQDDDTKQAALAEFTKIQEAANANKTVANFNEQKPKLDEALLNAFKNEYNKTKEANSAEAAKFTDSKYDNAISHNTSEIEKQDAIVNADGVTVDQVKNATDEVKKLTELLLEYTKYLNKLAEVITDKDSFEEGEIKTEYNTDIENANREATTDITKDKLTQGITKLEEAMLKANRRRYEKSKAAAENYKTTVLDTKSEDYKSIKDEFSTEFTRITSDAETDSTSAKYKTDYKALDDLVIETKAKVAKREKELAYINAYAEFLSAQQNYLSKLRNPEETQEAQTAKLKELLDTAKQKYDVYVQAANDFNVTPVEFKIAN